MDKRVKYDWDEIQKAYDDENLSMRELTKRFGCCMSTMVYAVRDGKLTTRNRSESLKISHKNNPQRHTEETKKKISEIRKKFIRDNPDKAPYKLNHYSKGDSYPERYFKEVFEKENIPLKYHLQIGLYELDFYNEDYKIDIEIDGEQHYADKRIVESDIRRTNFLTSIGWRVYRIRWAEYQKLSHDEKSKIVEEVRKLMGPKL